MKQKVPLSLTDQGLDSALPIGRQVVLFGAGIFAPPAIHALRQRGLVPACICDNCPDKHGTRVMGIPVLFPPEAWRAFPDAAVIITAASRYIDEICSQADGMGWMKVYDCSCLLASFEYDRNSFGTGVSALYFDLDRYFYEYFLKFHPDMRVVPSIDVMITEKCSLRCRDCANLMQYYIHPQDLDFDELFNSLDILMKCVDHVLEFRLLGGETFMNRRAHEYIEKLRHYGNFTRVAVYSNGTIVPKEGNLRCLIHEDVYLRVTDYGSLSRKIRAMAEVFVADGVTHDTQKADGWQDCAAILKRERTPAELETVYANCCANKTLTLLKGRVYVCPFAANASNLGALPPFPEDILQLDVRRSRQEMRGRLFDMSRTRKFFSACEYCAGRPVGAAPLRAAIQASAPLPYKRLCEGDG